MADRKYDPQYWAKYDVQPAVPFPVTDWVQAYPALKQQLYGEQKRLAGAEYGDRDRAQIMRQIEDAQTELDRLLNMYVGTIPSPEKVVRKKPKPFEGVSGMIQRARGAAPVEDRPLNP